MGEGNCTFLSIGQRYLKATFSLEGRLIYSNATMSFLKEGKIDDYFINPKFETIINNNEFGEIFDGMLTLDSVSSMFNNFDNCKVI